MPRENGKRVSNYPRIEQSSGSEGLSRETNSALLYGEIDTKDLIGLYLREAGRTPLLNAEQEVELFKRIEKGQYASEKIAEGEIYMKDLEELKSFVDDGITAKNHVIHANQRLVISVAKKYIKNGVPFLDLISEGNIGMDRAIRKFEWQRGLKFSTYATWWIRQAVTRGIAQNGRTIRIPVHTHDRINRMLRTTLKLTQGLGREPTNEELAEELDETIEKIVFMKRAALQPLSLETPTAWDGDTTLGDFIADETSPDPEESVTNESLKNHLGKLLQTLTHREARILKYRFGLIDGKSHSLNEVGVKFGLTRERIRQIEHEAIGKLRGKKGAWELKVYLQDQ